MLSNRSKGINSISAVQKGKKIKKREKGLCVGPQMPLFFAVVLDQRQPLSLTGQRQSENGPVGSSGELKRFDYC